MSARTTVFSPSSDTLKVMERETQQDIARRRKGTVGQRVRDRTLARRLAPKMRTTLQRRGRKALGSKRRRTGEVVRRLVVRAMSQKSKP